MSGMTPFADVKSSLPAEKVLGRYLGPSRHHTWHCPFHEDRTPSLSAHGPAIRCFGCQWAGDIFRFVETHLQVNRGEALRILADMAGVILPSKDERKPPCQPAIVATIERIHRESKQIERDIFDQAKRAAAQAWRQVWKEQHTEQVWDAVAVGTALHREVELLRVSHD